MHVSETALTRLQRHQAALHRPELDLAWWLWDLAGDSGGPQLLEQLAAVRKTDEIGRLLLRRRVLVVGTPPSLDALAETVLQRWGRRISRQGLHTRELDLRRQLEAVLELVDRLAITTYLDQRLAEATHVDDLDSWERAVVTAEPEADADWPTASDAAAAVATVISRRHAVSSDGWWFNGASGTTQVVAFRQVVEKLRQAFPSHDLVPGLLWEALGASGVTHVSGQRLAQQLIADQWAIETPSGTVLFPTEGSPTIAERLLYLHQLVGMAFEEAADLLMDQHNANRGSVSNAVRDLRRRGGLEPPSGSPLQPSPSIAGDAPTRRPTEIDPAPSSRRMN